MTETTTRALRFDAGEIVYDALPGQCSHCGKELAATMAVVEYRGIYNTHVVSLIDRSYPWPAGTVRLCEHVDELTRVGASYDGIIHASPEDIAAAVDTGWLEPGAEFYGCEFRKENQ